MKILLLEQVLRSKRFATKVTKCIGIRFVWTLTTTIYVPTDCATYFSIPLYHKQIKEEVG